MDKKSPQMLLKTDVFLLLTDAAISATANHFETLKYYMWDFLYNSTILSKCEDLFKKCMDLRLHLQHRESCDINGSELCEELIHIQSYFASLSDVDDAKKKITPGQVLQFVYDHNLDDIFPNIWISI